jgi:hypothetical protein
MFANELALHRREQELHIRAPNLEFPERVFPGPAEERGRGAVRFPPLACGGYEFEPVRSRRGAVRDQLRFVGGEVLGDKIVGLRFDARQLAARIRERRSVSHLSATAAESWCIDNIAVSTSGLDPNRQDVGAAGSAVVRSTRHAADHR